MNAMSAFYVRTDGRCLQVDGVVPVTKQQIAFFLRSTANYLRHGWCLEFRKDPSATFYTQLIYPIIHRMQMHQYADGIQYYVCTIADDDASGVDRFAACLTEIEAWLKASRLRPNPTKTQVMWLGSSQQLVKLDISRLRVLSFSPSPGCSR